MKGLVQHKVVYWTLTRSSKCHAQNYNFIHLWCTAEEKINECHWKTSDLHKNVWIPSVIIRIKEMQKVKYKLQLRTADININNKNA